MEYKTNNTSEGMVYRSYRDTLFRFIFQNERHKEWALSLFNAINHTSYDDPSKLEFGITEDKVLYIAVQEDVTFIFESVLQLIEHQSLFTPNLPFRMLEYSTKQLSVYAEKEGLNEYGTKKIKLPKPRCIVIYNGRDKSVPEETVLKLSDLYRSKKEWETLGNGFDVEVIVHVLNVNSGYNKTIQKGCKPLEEYCWIVNSVYDLMDHGISQSNAVQMVIAQLPKDFAIRNEIMKNRAMVIKLLLDEMSNERKLNFFKQACLEEGEAKGITKGIKQGIKQGISQGISQEKIQIVRVLLQKNMPDDFIMEVARITKTELEAFKHGTMKAVDIDSV